MGFLRRSDEEGNLSRLAIVVFNPLGGYQVEISSTMRVSELALAIAVLQRELQFILTHNPVLSYPKPPAA